MIEVTIQGRSFYRGKSLDTIAQRVFGKHATVKCSDENSPMAIIVVPNNYDSFDVVGYIVKENY